MNRYSWIRWPGVLLALLLAVMPQTVWACATCFGRSDSNLARGMNWGIFALLLVLLAVFAGIVSFFIVLARRADRMASGSAPADSAAPLNSSSCP